MRAASAESPAERAATARRTPRAASKAGSSLVVPVASSVSTARATLALFGIAPCPVVVTQAGRPGTSARSSGTVPSPSGERS